LGKPASLHATTAFLASNVYAGQHPKPQHGVPTPKGKPYNRKPWISKGILKSIKTKKDYFLKFKTYIKQIAINGTNIKNTGTS